MLRCVVPCLVLLALCAPRASAQEPAAPADAPAPSSGAPGISTQLVAICRQLSDPDFSAREAAQRALEAIPPEHVALVQAAAAAETDPEAKARLQQRIEQMTVHLALHPPGLTVEFTDLSLADTVAALNAALHLPVFSTAATPAGRFSLDLTDAPLWECIRRLQLQERNLYIAPVAGTPPGVRLSVAAAGARQPTLFQDPFVFTLALTGQRTAAANAADPNPAFDRIQLRLRTFVDPRVSMFQYSPQLQITELTDNAGKSLLARVVPAETRLNTIAGNTIANWYSTALVDIAGVPTRYFGKVKGLVRATVITRQEHAVVDDLMKAADAPIETAVGTITLLKDAPDTAQPILLITRRTAPESLHSAFGPASSAAPVYVRIFARDQRLLQQTTIISPQPRIALARFPADTQPWRLELTAASGIGAVSIPVEFDGLLLPTVQPPRGNFSPPPGNIQILPALPRDLPAQRR